MQKKIFISCFLLVICLCGFSCSFVKPDELSESIDVKNWNLSGDTFSHDPTIIKTDKGYWSFFTANHIGRKFSEDGRTWISKDPVFATFPSWWKTYVPLKTDANIWAPEIVFYNNTYYLFYSVSTFGSKISCIGLLSAPSLDTPTGQWKDLGMVIRSSASTTYNAIDPAFSIYNQKPYLTFGSWHSGIYSIELDSSTLKPVSTNPTQIAYRTSQNEAVEGPAIWNPGNGYYYLIASYDKCCDGVNSTYKIRYGRGLSPLGPFFSKGGNIMTADGGTYLYLGNKQIIGPGGQCVFKTDTDSWAMGYHYYRADDGRATLGICNIGLDKDGWIISY